MAVNRYFDRTLMPYNPIERPMPFDQILQAGLMKQQSLDRTLAAVDEFSEQKMLMGGARTLDAAKQLNQKYIGRASDLTNQIMTGAITPEQAGFELRNINKEYNKSNAVKQVLADQGLANLSNQASVNQRLLAKRAENPNWDYDAGSFRQESVEDLETGRATIDARGYGLIEDPGIFEDFSGELAQIHEQYIKESGVTDFYYDPETGRHKETVTNNVIEIDEKRVRDMIEDYVYRGELSESDKQSVLYRIARYNRLDPNNPYTQEQLVEDLVQASSFIPYRSTQKTQDIASSGGKKGSGSTKTEEEPLPNVQVELDTFTSEQMDIRNKIYGINEDDPIPGMSRLLSEQGRLEAANKKLAMKGFRLKQDANGKVDLDNPEFVYAGGGSDGKDIEFGADIDAARRQYQEFKNDVKFYQGIEDMTQTNFERKVGKSMDRFVEDIVLKHGDVIDDKLTEYVTSPPNEADSKFIERMKSDSQVAQGSAAAKEALEVELGKTFGQDRLSINYDTMTADAADVFPDFPVDGTYTEKQAFLRSKYIELGLDEADVERFATQEYFTGTGAADKIANPNKVPLAVIAKAQTVEGDQVREALRLTFSKEATMDVLKEVDPAAYRDYQEVNKIATDLILENNRYKVGRMLNTQEGKEGNKEDKLLEFTVLRNTSLVLKGTEGDPGSGEKGGETLGGLYSKTNTAIDDFKLLSMYFSEGPSGDVQIYGRVMYSPSRNVDEDQIENVKEGISEITGVVQEKGEAGRQMEFDVNITDNAIGNFVGQDLELIYQAASMMKDHVYTMDRGDTRNIYIPGKYGPATEVTINHFGDGIVLEGNVYGPDEDGGVKAIPVMEYWKQSREKKGIDTPGQVINGKWTDGPAMKLEEAAEFAALIAESTAGVKRNHKYLFDENGKYVGEAVPPRIDERLDQINESLSQNVDKITSSFNSVYKNTDRETIDELIQIMRFETNGTLKPDKRNSKEGNETAIGLIQFQQDRDKDKIKTIGGKEFTFEELARMSIPNQINKAMVPYLEEVGGRVKSIDDLYFAVFMPVFAGMDKNLTLQEAYEAGVGIAGEKEMKGLDPANLKLKNKSFNQAKTLDDIVKSVRTWGQF